MDRNSSHKAPRRRPNNALDGVFISGKANQARPNNAAFRKPTGAKSAPVAKTRLDNFKAADGFHAVSQPKLRAPMQAQPARPASGRNPKRDAKGRIDMSLPPSGADKKRKSGKRSWKKIAFRSVASVVVVVVLIFGLLVGQGILKTRRIFKGGKADAVALQENVDPTKLKGEGDGRVNIMLLGVGGVGHDGPDLTDTILIASIDPINHKASMLSLPRDLWVKMPQNKFVGGYQKINAAYESGKYTYLGKQDASNANTAAVRAGFAMVDQVVTQVLGIPIHYHVLVDFAAFKQAIDTVGGVTFNVPEQLYDPTIAWENHNNPVIAKAGLQTFNGTQALLYARSRETSSDFARTERQRAVLLALKDKVLSAGTLSNPAKLSGLISAFGNNVVTDLSTNEASRVYDIGKQIADSDIVSVGLADPPNHYVTTGNIDGISIVQPTAGLFVYTDIQNFVRNTLKDGYIASENAKILILNGTTTGGLATTKSTELKSYGYNILGVGDAPTKTYQKTVLVDLSKGLKKYTKTYLEKRLNVTSTTKLPDATINPGTADFVIILGSNESIH